MSVVRMWQNRCPTMWNKSKRINWYVCSSYLVICPQLCNSFVRGIDVLQCEKNQKQSIDMFAPVISWSFHNFVTLLSEGLQTAFKRTDHHWSYCLVQTMSYLPNTCHRQEKHVVHDRVHVCNNCIFHVCNKCITFELNGIGT